MQPTGKYRYRVNWLGKMILQVEERGLQTDCIGGWLDTQSVIRWRDARIEDFTSKDTCHD